MAFCLRHLIVMPIAHLTKRVVQDLRHPEAGQVFYYDDQLRGFGLRVGRRSKAFFCEAMVRRRTVRVTIGRFPVCRAEHARKTALGLLGQMAAGINPNADRKATAAKSITLKEAFDGFFADKPKLSPNTIPNYRRTIDLYLADWQRKPISEITRQMVMARHRKIGEERGEITANNVMRHLRSIYNHTAAVVGELPPNPVEILSQARAWTSEGRRRTSIDEAALPRWYQAVLAQDERVRDFLLVALFTGMRRSEIATLRWECVDLSGGTLTVPRTKNGDPLELPLSTFLLGLLRRRRLAASASPWVFPSPGKSGHIEEPKSATTRVAKASGVPFTIHDLRRTFITIAESLDIPAYTLKRLLNHRTSGDVTGGYIVISTDRLRAPVEKIAARIESLITKTQLGARHAV